MGQNNKSKSIISSGLLLLTAMVWGFAFVAQRSGSEHLGAFAFNGIRFALGALSLIPVILIFERDKPDQKKKLDTVKYGAIVGAILFTASAFQQIGIEITQSAGKAGFITGLYTVLVPIVTFILLKQKNSVNVWIGAIIAVVGLFLLSVSDNFTVGLGDLILLCGAIFYTLHIITIDRVVDRVSPLKFAAVQFFTCAILNLIIGLFVDSYSLEAIGAALIPLLYGGLGSVGVAYTLQIVAQKNVPPTPAAIIMSTEAMFSAIGGALILHETMSARGYVGCALIFCGIILAQLKFNNKAKENKEL